MHSAHFSNYDRLLSLYYSVAEVIVGHSFRPVTSRYHISLLHVKFWVHKFSRSNLKILDGRTVIRSQFCAEYAQILGAAVRNIVGQVKIRLEFVHPCLK
jgi:hypothetical protein